MLILYMGNCFKSMPDIKAEATVDNNHCPSNCCLNDRFYCCLVIKQSNIKAEDVVNDHDCSVIHQPEQQSKMQNDKGEANKKGKEK